MRNLLRFNARRRHQLGMSLLMSLLMLLVMSVTVISAMQVAGLQERTAGNFRDRTLAFNAAESALRDAEAYLSTGAVLPLFNGSDPGHYGLNNVLPTAVESSLTRLPAMAVEDVSSVDLWRDPAAIAFLRTNGIIYGAKTGLPALPDVSVQPRFVIEQANPTDSARMRSYRITALAEGRDAALVVLQSYYTPPQFTVTP